MSSDKDPRSAFIRTHFAVENDHDRATQEATRSAGLPEISINAEEGQFLRLLAAASGGRLAVEIGSLGGYSGTWIARGLKPGGLLITIDLEAHHSKVARENITRAGLADRVEFLTGRALDVLPEIAPRGPFDFVFIDADKGGYPDYYAWAVDNVRSGGIITAHNAFRGGRIFDARPDNDTRAIVDFLKMVAGDQRVVSTIYPAGDGTLVAVKN